MRSKFKPKNAYYSVHALRDGTIVLAVPTRKPTKTKESKPSIVDDGIWRWFLEDGDTPNRFGDRGKVAWYSAVTNSLNTRRVIRQQVEPKLVELIDRVEAMQKQINRLEEKIDAIAATASSGDGT
jgi:hypothetical protein